MAHIVETSLSSRPWFLPRMLARSPVLRPIQHRTIAGSAGQGATLPFGPT